MRLFLPQRPAGGSRNGLKVFRAMCLASIALVLSLALSQVPVQADPPLAIDDSGVGFATDEDTSFITANVLSNDGDPDGDPLYVAGYDVTATLGQVTDNGDGTFYYDPNDQFEYLAISEQAIDTFAYVVSDGNGGTDTATVSITVDGVNDPPTLAELPDQTLDEDTSLDKAIDLWAYASDVETADSGLTFTIDNAPDPDAGVSIDANRYVDIQPAANWYGSTEVRIKVTDPDGASDIDTFLVTVNPVNDPPWIDPAVPDQSADEDVAISIDLTPYEHDVESSGTDLDWSVSGEDHCTVSGENSDDDVLTFTPHANFHGSDTVLLTLSDPQGGTDTQSLVLTWNPVNDPPVLDPLPDQSLDEDTSLDNAIDLWAYASDAETADSGLTFTIDNAPDPDAGVSIDANRYVDIQPAANWHGSTEVRIKVTDPSGASDIDTFQVTVNPVNDAPWIDPVVPDRSADEDVAISIDLTFYEHDVESSGTDLDWSVSGEDHCTVSGENSDDDVLTFTPQANYYGSDTILLTLTDAQGGTDTQSLVLTWHPVNDPPVLDALPDQSLDEDTSLDNAIDLWAYASDAETADGGLTFTIDNAPDPNAGVSIDANRYVDIQPAANWYGSTEVRIKVTDPSGASDIDTFLVTVNPVNDPPWIDPVVPDRSADEDVAISIDLTPYEHDVESSGTDLDWTVSDEDHCTVSGENSDDDVLTFAPNANFYGSDTILLTLTDAQGGTDTQSLVLTWHPVNDLPTLDALPDQSLDEDTSLDNAIDLWAYASDVETADGGLTFTIDNAPDPNAGVSIDASRYVDIQPAANWYGSTEVRIKVTDPDGASDTETFQVTVDNVNDDPDAKSDGTTVDEDSGANEIDVLGNDSYEPDPPETLTISAVTQGDHGSVAITGGGTGLTYTPDPDYYGEDYFRYTIEDGNGGSDKTKVEIIVNNVNDDPDANRDSSEMDEDSGANAIDVLENDSYEPDPPETLIVIGVLPASDGSVAITGGGTGLTYTPDPDYYGTDTFSYIISDGNGGYDTARVDVTVNGVNDPPNAVDDWAFTDEDEPVTVDVLKNDSDIDGKLVASSVEVISEPSHGSTSVNSSNGKITYTPDDDWNGSDSFTYQVCDDGTPLPSQCSTAVVWISADPVNDPPIANAGPDQSVDTNSLVTLDGSASTDPDNHLPLTYRWTQTGGSTVILSDPNSPSPTFTAPGDPEVLTFELEVIDSQWQADLTPDEVAITVNNQPPIPSVGSDRSVVINTSVTLDGSASSDPDDDLPLTYVWTQTGGPSVTLSNPTSPWPTFWAPEEPTVLTFKLLVIDSLGLAASTPDWVVITVREPFRIYMPLVVTREYVFAPDLVVQRVSATANSVQVVIANQGTAPVSNEFFVDLYINPYPPPSAVNQEWWDLADQGIVWGVTQGALPALVPGGALTLSLGDAYYVDHLSDVKWPLSAGMPLYAQVDSYNPGIDYGTVLERHEILGEAYNNVGGPFYSAAAIVGGSLPAIDGDRPTLPNNLPARALQ